MSKLDEFDPNNRDAGAPQWATYAPYRYEAPFKFHRARSGAISAFGFQRPIAIYEWIDGKWVERARAEYPGEGTSICMNCGQSTMRPTPNGYNGIPRPDRNVGDYYLVRNLQGKVADDPLRAVFLDRDCARALGYLR